MDCIIPKNKKYFIKQSCYKWNRNLGEDIFLYVFKMYTNWNYNNFVNTKCNKWSVILEMHWSIWKTHFGNIAYLACCKSKDAEGNFVGEVWYLLLGGLLK